MGCNCKGKTMNNLQIPAYIRMAKEIWATYQNKPREEYDEFNWQELYTLYNNLYPNSKGQPNKEELIEIITNAANYRG